MGRSVVFKNNPNMIRHFSDKYNINLITMKDRVDFNKDESDIISVSCLLCIAYRKPDGQLDLLETLDRAFKEIAALVETNNYADAYVYSFEESTHICKLYWGADI